MTYLEAIIIKSARLHEDATRPLTRATLYGLRLQAESLLTLIREEEDRAAV